MTKVKFYLVIFGFLAAGLFCLFDGIADYRVSKRLESEGQKTMAVVVEKDKTYRRRGRSKCYLTVQYQTGDQQDVIARVKVPGAIFSMAEVDGAVPLRYLPADPGVCSVGESVDTPYEHLVYGLGLLAVTAFLWFNRDNPQDTKEAAKQILATTRANYSSHHEYVTVKAEEFRHLDLRWYDERREALIRQGFIFLQDQEDVTLARTANGPRTLLRFLLDRSGTTMACLYHFKPHWKLRLLGDSSPKVIGFETQFSDGSWVCTSNAKEAGAIKLPAAIHSLHLDTDTSMEFLLQAHEQRVAKFLAEHPGVEPLRMSSIQDVQKAQNAQEKLKADFRRETPISREELECLAGREHSRAVDQVHAEIIKLDEEEKRKAA